MGVAALPVSADGALGAAASVIKHQGSSVNPQRQEAPHGHFIAAVENGRFALACDLGLDKVLVYNLDAGKAALWEYDPPAALLKPGAGPRHLAFSPNERVAYVINELDSTITSFHFNAKKGTLKE